MIWEFGEHVKFALDCLGLTEQRIRRWCPWAICWCEQRRAWLNETGETLWAAIDGYGYVQTRGRFLEIVEVSLSAFPLRESSLVAIAWHNGIRVSRHTVGRWLSQMVAADALSEMTDNGERWLSLR